MSTFYTVLYTKKAPGKKRKNKSFADGLLAVDNASYKLYDEAGQIVARENLRACNELSEGAELSLESWDLEIDQKLSEDDFRQRRQAMTGTAEEHVHPTEASNRKQLVSLDKRSHVQAPRLEDAFYAVIYTARTPGKKRKNKSFKDGVLRLCSNRSLLYDEEGKVIAERTGCNTDNLHQESGVAIGQWDTEVVEELSAEIFRAGTCFQKSAETLLLEKLHASRSATTDLGQVQAAHPVGSTTTGNQSSMVAPMSTGAAEGQAPTAVASVADGCQISRNKVVSTGCTPQQEETGVQPSNMAAQNSSCAGASTQVHKEIEPPIQPRETQLLQRPEGAGMAAEPQRKLDAHTRVSFLDDVDCLDIE